MMINYKLQRSRKRKRTISLQVVNPADVVVSAPYFTPLQEIETFVQNKSAWIKKIIEKQNNNVSKNPPKSYTKGEDFYYLGKAYPLNYSFSPDKAQRLFLTDDYFYLNCRDNSEEKQYYFIKWYKARAKDYLTRHVDELGKAWALAPSAIKITSAKTRWGSCGAKNNLSFSFRLIMAPPAVIDYVIVHELMHIRQKNHSSKFWHLVERAMPDYKIHRRWLRENGGKFNL